MYETKVRSVVKAISWRIIATLTTAVLVFLFTGRLDIAAAVGAVEVVAKIVFYFIHERVWDRLSFGRKAVTPAGPASPAPADETATRPTGGAERSSVSV